MTREEFKTLKPGDKVKIIDTPVAETKYGAWSMNKWCGKIMTVRDKRTSYNGKYIFALMEEDKKDIPDGWDWFSWMIEKKVETEDSPGGIELLKRENSDLKAEIVRLKARLFDYMDEK